MSKYLPTLTILVLLLTVSRVAVGQDGARAEVQGDATATHRPRSC